MMSEPRALLWRRCAGAATAGVVLSLAYEPLAWAWLLVPAVTAFWLCLRGLTVRRGFCVGLAFGVGFYFVHIWWMRAVAVPAWVLLAGIEALFYGLLGGATAAWGRRRGAPLWSAAAWVTMEVWRSQWPFSGMPWGRLAFAVVDTPAQRALPYVGMVGVSFLLALATASLAAVLAEKRGRRSAGIVLTVVVVAFVLPLVRPFHGQVVGERTIAAVQGDVPGPGNDILFDYRGVTQNHVDATVGLAARVAGGSVPRPDFVVWPENSTAVDPFLDSSTNAQIWQAARAIDVPILVGAIVDENERYALNQGIVWDPQTGGGDRYTKRHPVPYGEYIPFRSLIDANFGDLAQITRDMRAGTRREPLLIADTSVADAICFDIAYDDGVRDQVTRGAQVLVVQTSNATFIHTDQIDQQFAITRLRAIESGKWTVVASTNGRSGIISPSGEVVDTADPRTTAVLLDRVDLITGVSPGLWLDPWIGRLCILATLAGLVAVTLAYRRGRKIRTSVPEYEQESRG